MSNRWAPLALLLAVACGGGGGAASGGDEAKAEPAADDVATVDPADPCRLVSQQEMEAFMGPLLQPPYRVKDRRPDPAGDGCLYRAKDYRNVTIELDREAGELGFRMLGGTGTQIEEALVGTDVGLDTLEASWDRIARPFGHLIALKDSATVLIDPIGSRLDLGDQVRLISMALGRLGQPLTYDGAQAARRFKDMGVAARDPCTLVTAAEAEALMGKLRAAPHVSDEGDACVFPLVAVVFGQPMDRSLQVLWSDGFYALGQERQAMGMAGKMMPMIAGDADAPRVGENVAGEAEPWDERITLLGGVVTVVKRDVMLKIAAEGMDDFDEARALVLLRKAVGRI